MFGQHLCMVETLYKQLMGSVASGIRPPWMVEVSKMQDIYMDLDGRESLEHFLKQFSPSTFIK